MANMYLPISRAMTITCKSIPELNRLSEIQRNSPFGRPTNSNNRMASINRGGKARFPSPLQSVYRFCHPQVSWWHTHTFLLFES